MQLCFEPLIEGLKRKMEHAMEEDVKVLCLPPKNTRYLSYLMIYIYGTMNFIILIRYPALVDQQKY